MVTLKDNISTYCNHPTEIGKAEIAIIQNTLHDFPYFTALQMLLAKGLLNTDSIYYNRQLRKAAAYCPNRKSLFQLITSEKIKNPQTIHTITTQIEKEKNPKEDLAIGQPLSFTPDETHSFSEWLALTKVNKIDRKADAQSQLVSKFVANSPSISRPTKETFFSPTESAKESLLENEDIVTETLARVYLEQGHYEKAISSYQKLCLKFPQKSSLFAAQIKLIEELIIKNK